MHQLLKTDVDPQFYVIDLGVEPGAELIVDLLEVGGDLDVERGPHAGEPQLIDDPHGSRTFLEGLLKYRGALLAEGQAECRRVVTEQRGD